MEKKVLSDKKVLAGKPVILIVDDEEGIRAQLTLALSGEYEIVEASDHDSAIKAVHEHDPSLVALDVSLIPGSVDGTEGMTLLRKILEHDSRVKVIMITANDEKPMMLKAVAEGAFDYYVKPINLDEIKVMFKRALYLQQLEKENEQMAAALMEKQSFSEMIGTCDKMQELFRLIRRVAPTDATVLVTGESGTGKELVARALHYASNRRDHPFIVINCGAIPENLLESELFGHEKGAFTDAYTQKIGKVELADKGTVFLDEIGELTLSLQVKLLRFLQEHVIERVGGNKPIELDVRVIAATNSDLQQRMSEGTFREDLFYRLSVVSLDMPPLRMRSDDIVLIATHYLEAYSREAGKKIKGFSKDALKSLLRYSWPGNVRELENKIRRAVILRNSSLINSHDLGFQNTPESFTFSLKTAREKIEQQYIREALAKHKGNISRTSRELGISRVSLYDLMKRYKIGHGK